jgi:pyridoxamine 5'-phosphate oxidase
LKKTSREDSEKYFKSRPVDSQIAAWASNQSRIIDSRAFLEQRFDDFKAKFGDDVPLPDFWGGFRLTPDRFEFWQGRQNRLHDRVCYTPDAGAWTLNRLSP